MKITGQWKGFYVYDETYGPAAKGKKAFFKINFTYENGVLAGTVEDTHGFGIQTKRFGTVKGFIQKKFISFIKTYDKIYELDENWNEIAVINKSYNVQYTGTFNSVLQIFEGEWEIIESEERVNNDQYKTYLFTGTWKMKQAE